MRLPRVIGAQGGTYLVQIAPGRGRLFRVAETDIKAWEEANIDSILCRGVYEPIPENEAADVLALFKHETSK